MSNIELQRANERLFATAEEFTTISNQLVIARIGEEYRESGDLGATLYPDLGGLMSKEWSMLNQVEADIEDETCQLFGLVGGFLLDTIRADRIRLNTEKISDGFIKIINLAPEVNCATVDRQIDATGERYDSRTLEMGLGGVRRATRFVVDVNNRLEAIVSDIANTASK